MFKKIRFTSAAILLSLATLAPDFAKAETNNIDMLALAIGFYDINDDNQATDFRAEYEFGEPLVWDIRPWLGVEVTSESAIYAAGGFYYEYELAQGFYIVPSIGAGLYSEGDGKDLGNTLEFRTQLEFQYEFDNQTRFSLGISHISNANMGNSNPGTEVLSLYYHIPISKLF